MSDLDFQAFSTVQNKNQQTQPSTIVAAATIAPVNFLTFVAGTTAVATITPPVTGVHMLAIVATSTNWAGAVTSGNIIAASVTNSELWLDKVNLFVYNPINAKYYPSYAVHNTTV
jgi:hypothetical protein